MINDWRKRFKGLGTTINAPPPDNIQEIIDLPRLTPGVQSVKVEGSVATAVAVSLVESTPAKTLEVLGKNDMVRVCFSETRGAVENENGDSILVEGEVCVSGKLECLKWAAENNKKMYRRLVKRFYGDYLDMAEKEDMVEALKIWRLLRATTPVKNLVSKKEPVMGAGLTTLSKIRGLALRVPGRKFSVIFGVGNWKHNMGYLPGVRRCVDSDAWSSPEESDYYVRGKLDDWRKWVNQGDLIISDCSLGEGYEGGMQIPESYYGVYDEMTKAGHYVICKASKEADWVYTRRHMDSASYRPHNMEIFLLLSPRESENNSILDRDLVEEEMRDWNNHRMRAMMKGEFCDFPDKLTVSAEELYQVESVTKTLYFTGVKDTSVISALVNELNPVVGGSWEEDCLNKYYRAPIFEEYLDLDEELPVVLLDVGHLAKDRDRLMASFHLWYEMEFDEDVGWVAVKKRKGVKADVEPDG